MIRRSAAQPDGLTTAPTTAESAIPLRAQTLERAHQVLTGSIDRLAGSDDLDAFLAAVMRESADAIGGGECQLFLYDAETGLMHPGLAVTADGVIPPPGLAAGLPIEKPFPGDITEAWPRVLASDGPVVFDPHTDIEVFWPGTLDLHRARGHAQSVCVALKVGTRPIGMMGYTTTGLKKFTADDLDLCGALARQAALAIHLQTLSATARDQAVEAALAREHAADLAKANDALQRVLSLTEAGTSPQEVLGLVLREAAAIFGSDCAEYWDHPPGTDSTVFIDLLVIGGRLLTRAEIEREHPTHPGVAGYTVPPAMIGGEPLRRRTRHFVIENSTSNPFTRHLDWFPTHGLAKEINVPLNAGGETIGALIVRMRQDFEITPGRIELARALAAQAALAVQLGRIAAADREKAVALAVERERMAAAAEKSRQLEEANDALRRSVARLVEDGSLPSFLHSVLLESAILTGAVSNAIFLYDPGTDSLSMTAFVTAGAVVDIARDPRMALWREPVPASLTEAWREVSISQRILWIDNEHPTDEHWPMGIQWHRDMGHRVIGVLPLIVGDTILGFMGPCFATAVPPTESRLRQCMTFAQQAALALQLTSLAEQAQAKAVEIALVGERATAAAALAAELGQSNAALRRVNAALATGAGLPALLARILEEACAHTGACGGAAFTLDEEGKTLTLAGALMDGRFVRELPDYPFGAGRDLPISEQGVMNRLASLRRPIWIDVEGPDAVLMATGTPAWHRERGHGALILAPLVLGAEVAGFLGLSFPQRDEPSPATLELVDSLAQQATLALEMTRLSGVASRTAVTEERNRLAREIHDTLAQGFAAIMIHLRSLARERMVLSPRSNRALDTIETLAQDSLLEARRSVAALRPRLLAQTPLPEALRSLVAATEGDPDPPALSLVIDPALAPLPTAVEDELFRIAQEAVANAVRHARAGHIDIRLRAGEPEGVRLDIMDDGQGFAMGAVPPGYGLTGMAERAGRIGAGLAVISAPGAGTRISAIWPADPA